MLKLINNRLSLYLAYLIVLCIPNFHTNIYGKLVTLALTVMVFIITVEAIKNKRLEKQSQ
ncbi:hypothetical protein [Holzapfeliella sp. JNUCC 72]